MTIHKRNIPMLEREIAGLERKEAYRRRLGRIITGFLTIAAVITVITNLWLSVLQINGSSMNPLLKRDEIVLAVKGGVPVKNDIIAFYKNHQLCVKRVIAGAGDWVWISSQGRVTVGNEVLEELYISEFSLGNCDLTFPYQVPAGMLFVMGDNRPSSKDSRLSGFGPVSKERIVGKVRFRVWPLSRLGSVS